MTSSFELLAALRDAVGAAYVQTDPDVTVGHVVDWTGRFRGVTPAVVRPGSVDEVAAVLAACNEARAAVVPQGGNTGLVGGSVPLHGEIVLDVRRLDALGPVDGRTGQVTAQAGVTLARLQQHAHAAGWQYGVDLGARDVATVGGTIATNAGGVHVLRHGPTRRQLVGIEAILADGRVIRRLDGLEKDNTGYDLASLICGSEGTLAVVTAARVRLVPRPSHVVAALLAFDDVETAFDAVGELRRTLDCVQALEFFLQDGLDLVVERLHLSRPFATRHDAYVLVEAAANSDPVDALARAVGELGARGARARAGAPAEVAVASDDANVRALWRYREGHTEAINLLGAPHKLDVSLPAGRLASFVRDIPARASAWSRPSPRVVVRPRRRRQHARERHRRRARRRTRHRERVALRGRAARFDQRRARHRHREEAIPRARPVTGRDCHLPRDQSRARSPVDIESPCPAAGDRAHARHAVTRARATRDRSAHAA